MPVDESEGENGSGRFGIDPHSSKSFGNSSSHINDDYASGADWAVEGTPQKHFDEQEGLSGPRCEKLIKPYHLEEGEVVTRFP